MVVYSLICLFIYLFLYLFIYVFIVCLLKVEVSPQAPLCYTSVLYLCLGFLHEIQSTCADDDLRVTTVSLRWGNAIFANRNAFRELLREVGFRRSGCTSRCTRRRGRMTSEARCV